MPVSHAILSVDLEGASGAMPAALTNGN